MPVDTVRYYQSRGLLDPPRREGRIAWYGSAHLERLARIRELQAQGLTLATIGRLLRGELDASDEALVKELTGPLPPAPSSRAGAPASGNRPATPGPGPDSGAGPGTGSGHVAADPGPNDPPEAAEPAPAFTLAELADHTGVPLALLKAIEAEGLLVPRRIGTVERYTIEDVAAAHAGLLLLEHGIPLGALLDLARRHHEATEETAREAVDLFATYIRGPLREGGTTGPTVTDAEGGRVEADRVEGDRAEHDHTAALLEAYTTLLPAVTDLVGHHFNRLLTRAALARLEGDGTPEERHLAVAQHASIGTDNGSIYQGIPQESHSLVELDRESSDHRSEAPA